MSAESASFERLVEYLRVGRGFDFTGYKQIGLARRIKKRMQTVSIETFDEYVDYLEVHPDEYDRLFDTILINVTSFYRDPMAWAYLQEKVIPQMVTTRADGSGSLMRVWSAGCASGEEAYTVAMVFAEALGREQTCSRVKIYATDVDENALNQARAANYSAHSMEALPSGFAEKYFVKQPSGQYAFDKDLRRCVIFGQHDLLRDAPISRVHMLTCRNALMYFNAESQSKILTKFHFALHESGCMFLGRAETLLTRATLFTPVNLPHRVFAKVPALNLRDRLLILAHNAGYDGPSAPIANIERLRESAFDAGSQAQLVIDLEGNLAMANDRAREVFKLSGHDVGRPAAEMDLLERPIDMRQAIDRAYAERRPQYIREAEWIRGGERSFTDVEIVPLKEMGGTIIGVGVSFADVTRFRRLQDDLTRSGQELEAAYEELQSTSEELETTNEELQSTVEELETTNEELQSSNEELETMNQELQSTNEELTSTNNEASKRTEQVHALNDFLSTVLGSLNTAIVAVDGTMRVTAWNKQSEELWGLRTDEVLGENLLNLDSGLPVDQLRAPVREVMLDGDEPKTLQIEAMNRRGRHVRCNVICKPLNGMTGERQGVILLLDQVRDDTSDGDGGPTPRNWRDT